MKMNIPNQLTLFRMLMVPAFLAAAMLEFNNHELVAVLLFGGACITDFIDGLYARTHNQVTVFGSLMDPVADKLITTAALLVFVYHGWCNFLIPVIILTRDYIMTAVRIVASKQGVVIPANIWGKLKTIFQMVFSGLILIANVLLRYDVLFEAEKAAGVTFSMTLPLFANALMWIVALCSVISGLSYYLQSRKLLNTPESKKLMNALVFEEFYYPTLITGALIYFMSAGVVNILLVMTITAVSIVITSFQMIATSQDVTLPLKHWNALKTLSMLLLIVLLALKLLSDLAKLISPSVLEVAGNISIGLLALLCVIVGLRCMKQSKKKIDFSK